MRNSLKAALIAAIVLGAWIVWMQTGLHDAFSQYVENGEIITLEARYTPQQIMEAHGKELVKDEHYAFQEPSLTFYPYLLMEVKYTQIDKKSKEGVILWGMVDGEMVLNTDTWEKTHGFEDALNAKASPEEFKILNIIAMNGGSIAEEPLIKALNFEQEIGKRWIERAKDKHLIIKKSDQLFLHFQDPKILVVPQTKITRHLVTKPYNLSQLISKKYSKGQIERTAQAAFGKDFTIRNSSEVFLPVYKIGVLNPDDSVHTTYWNAINGQRITPNYLKA